MHPLRFLVAAALVLGACQDTEMVRSPGSAPQEEPRAARKTAPDVGNEEQKSPPPSSPAEETGSSEPPGPKSPLPDGPGATASALELAHLTLDELVGEWVERGARPGDALEAEIELWALHQQRLYRGLAKSPRTARKTIARLPSRIASAARANTGAQRDLSLLNQPLRPPIKLPRTRPAPATELLRFYTQAQRRFGVPWYVLASVNFVETRFGRLRGPSSAGALGPMQFLPSTWERYGNGGDILDPRDAILGAARYLSASGATADMRGALYAYNNSELYVNAILDYASQMRKDPRDYYAYYHWQVFVRTTKGDVQLTGPGKD